MGGRFLGTGVTGMYRFRYRESLQGIVTGNHYRDPAENSSIKFPNRQRPFDGIQSKITKLITTT